MKSNKKPIDPWLDKMTSSLLEQRLGRLEHYPPAVIERATQVYRPFLKAYVEIIRLKGQHAIDEQAPDIRIDDSVVDEMRHFFSDYQHLTRAYIRMDHLIARLAEIDRDLESHLFQQIVDEINSPDRQVGKTMAGVLE